MEEGKDKTRVYRLGGEEIPLPADYSFEEVREAMKKHRPEVTNAQFVEETDGSVSILVVEGEKGV